MLFHIKSSKLIFLFLFCVSFWAQAEDYLPVSESDPQFLKLSHSQWVDSLMKSMTVEEKIGQLFMVAAYSTDSKPSSSIVSYITQYKIGSLIFFQGGPVRQAQLTNYYQSLSRIPLLIGIDGEWGLAMRIDSSMKYPKQIMLGAIDNEDEIRQMGRDLGWQCQRLGIQINFAPVVDVNNNPNNPVINARSFGENLKSLNRKSYAYMMGLQDERILTSAKHFPGHGDTESDSHLMLPIINRSYKELNEVELEPFRYLIRRGVSGVMVGHLMVPALDSTTNQASSLSSVIVSDLLRKKMNFNGLIFTDALNMKGVASYFAPGEVAVKAFQAGADMLVMPDDLPKAYGAIKTALDSGKISMAQIDERCRKILMAKQWSGLANYKPVDLNNLVNDLNRPDFQYHKRQLIEKAITMVRNENELIPFKRLDTLKIASISIGYNTPAAFSKSLSRYAPVDIFAIDRSVSVDSFNMMLDKLKSYNMVIVSIVNTDIRPAKAFGITPASIDFVNKLSNRQNVVLVDFASPYSAKFFSLNSGLKSFIVAYEDGEMVQDIAGQMLFGAIPIQGNLPVSVSPELPLKMQITTNKAIRLKYTVPEEFGLSDSAFSQVDSIAVEAIRKHATPGCQVLIAKDGKVFYSKCFGNVTYDSSALVTPNTIYDIASVTKVAATVPAIMRLSDEKKINLSHKLKDYLPSAINTNKENILLSDLLLHQARLQPFIPYNSTLLQANPNAGQVPWLQDGYFTKTPDSLHTTQVADSLWTYTSMSDNVLTDIYKSPLLSKKEYKYSDLGFILLYNVAQQVTGVPFDKYLDSTLYRPLGATTLGYKPLARFSKSRIAPTENDLTFRKQLIQGYVHDPAAAIMGGVSGHAGLFTSANDLAKLMQLYLWEGEYGGQRYFNSSTLNLFTSSVNGSKGNRRGLGFDKPEPDANKPSPVSRCIPVSSFGHSGFTGTMVWMDPDNNLIFIFLSNRVYPDASINKLVSENIRSRMQDEIYKAFKICVQPTNK
jgi:beta-glucosidase-like glycosyl hydrolase/CubicO group peptidase (beta-lactamase class C family)